MAENISGQELYNHKIRKFLVDEIICDQLGQKFNGLPDGNLSLEEEIKRYAAIDGGFTLHVYEIHKNNAGKYFVGKKMPQIFAVKYTDDNYYWLEGDTVLITVFYDDEKKQMDFERTVRVKYGYRHPHVTDWTNTVMPYCEIGLFNPVSSSHFSENQLRTQIFRALRIGADVLYHIDFNYLPRSHLDRSYKDRIITLEQIKEKNIPIANEIDSLDGK